MNTDAVDLRLAAEQRARALIDAQLRAAGWAVQDKKDLNLFGAQGVAVRESIMAPGYGRADCLLYVDKAAVGVIEAKPVRSESLVAGDVIGQGARSRRLMRPPGSPG